MQRIIAAMLLVVSVTMLPLFALAATVVQVKVESYDCVNDLTFQSPSPTVTQFFGVCGDISIDPTGDPPEVAAETSGATDQLILRNTVITNLSDSTPHTITITFSHTFVGINTNQDRFYGMSVSGNFFRPPFDLASEDSLAMRSAVIYTKSNGAPLTEQIGGTIGTGAILQYSVPEVGSVSFNDFTPQNPAQVIEKINCRLIGGGNSCSLGETIETVLAVTLAPGDSIILAGSAHVPATGDLGRLARILAGFTAKIDIKPGQSVNFVGPDDNGALVVDLLGTNVSTEHCVATNKKGQCTQSVTIRPFDVNQVNFNNPDFPVVFGPNCPNNYPTGEGCQATAQHVGYLDSNGDGILDARIHFKNPDIGWNSDCIPANKTGTMVGTIGTIPPKPELPLFFTATDIILCQAK